MPRTQKLSDKQQRFIEEYLVDLNATAAARRAGYSERNADKIGPELLGKTRVAAAIQALRTKLTEKAEISALAVLNELRRIAFSDMRKFSTWGPSGVKLLDSEKLDDDAARCVAEVTETVTKEGGSIKFKLHNKVEALKLLGQHLALFLEKHEHTGRGGEPLFDFHAIIAAMKQADEISRNANGSVNGNGKPAAANGHATAGDRSLPH